MRTVIGEVSLLRFSLVLREIVLITLQTLLTANGYEHQICEHDGARRQRVRRKARFGVRGYHKDSVGRRGEDRASSREVSLWSFLSFPLLFDNDLRQSFSLI